MGLEFLRLGAIRLDYGNDYETLYRRNETLATLRQDALVKERFEDQRYY